MPTKFISKGKGKKRKIIPITNKKGIRKSSFNSKTSKTKSNYRIPTLPNDPPKNNFQTPSIQTLIFPRDKFTESSAKKWAREHGFKTTKTDLKPNTIRIRQISPKRIKKGDDQCAQFEFGDSEVKGLYCDVK